MGHGQVLGPSIWKRLSAKLYKTSHMAMASQLRASLQKGMGVHAQQARSFASVELPELPYEYRYSPSQIQLRENPQGLACGGVLTCSRTAHAVKIGSRMSSKCSGVPLSPSSSYMRFSTHLVTVQCPRAQDQWSDYGATPRKAPCYLCSRVQRCCKGTGAGSNTS